MNTEENLLRDALRRIEALERDVAVLKQAASRPADPPPAAAVTAATDAGTAP